jgi:2,5-dioxopentanoate dehydrogenase
MAKFKDSTVEDIDLALKDSQKSFRIYKKKTLKERAAFLYGIAKQLDQNASSLIQIAAQETNLQPARLQSELTRTIWQLNSYGAAGEEGSWLEVRISKNGPGAEKTFDLRKMLVPLGPVVVFGASNFPFAYSTAGGDTASALAAGCTVVVKAHPAHAETSEMVAALIKKAATACGLPDGVFIHVHGAAVEVGEALVKHDLTKAVGFTGSFEGGKALFDLANLRRIPIPVFAEMGSVNPVFILPEKLKTSADDIAAMYAISITQSAGQFCTNPGILVGIESEDLENLKSKLAKKISMVPPEKMLHPGIAKSFQHKRAAALGVPGVEVAGVFSCPVGADESIPTLAEVNADVFLKNPLLHKEVFGPFSMLIKCRDMKQMLQVTAAMEGQLTCSLMATDNEVKQNQELVDALTDICGRFVLNGVPTGVEVVQAMHHGGPFPATTDSRFTAVGSDAIKRFARPVCFQNWSNDLLPEELKNENPSGIWRMVNNKLTLHEVTP